MDGLAPRVRVPDQVSPGDVMEIRTLISHPMETGYRRDAKGELIPRHIIEEFVCEYNGERVFHARFGPAIAANPYLSFHVRARESGSLRFVWKDDRGETWETTRQVRVR